MQLPKTIPLSFNDVLSMYCSLNNMAFGNNVSQGLLDEVKSLKHQLATILNDEFHVSVFTGEIFPIKMDVDYLKKILEKRLV